MKGNKQGEPRKLKFTDIPKITALPLAEIRSFWTGFSLLEQMSFLLLSISHPELSLELQTQIPNCQQDIIMRIAIYRALKSLQRTFSSLS